MMTQEELPFGLDAMLRPDYVQNSLMVAFVEDEQLRRCMSCQVRCDCGIMTEWDLDAFSVEEGIKELLLRAGWTMNEPGTLICPDCSRPNRIIIEIKESHKDRTSRIANTENGEP